MTKRVAQNIGRPRAHRSAFTLVEVAVSVVIVGLLLATSVQVVGAAKIGQYRLTERARGNALAKALLAEILQLAYADPNTEAGETRATFDDVDDYDGLNESPPVFKDGTAMTVPQASTWQRTVAVTWIDPLTLATTGSESGAKKIVVTVRHSGRSVATQTAIRTSAP
ncbi:hypothetical protein BH09PLA1_BH09PLA1_08100 [soil metagenome]